MSGFSVPQYTAFYQAANAAGGSINVYQTGTTTLVTCYADGGLVTPITNPITLDSNGQAKFYVAGSTNLRIDSYTASGVFIETVDPVYPVSGVTSNTQGTVVYQATNLTLSTTNLQNNIIATAAINIALPLSTGFTDSFSVQLNAQGGAITLTCTAPDAIQKGTAGASFTMPQGATGELWTDAAGNWGINFYTGYGSSPIIGKVRNGLMSVASASASATFTADGIVVANALNGNFQLLPSYSQAINLAITGAGGMDTGSAPTSGYVSLYAIAKPNGTASIIACNVSSSSGSIYSGGHMPSGYTYSALIGIWPTTADTPGKFIVGYQRDRQLWFKAVTPLSGGTQTNYTSVALNSFIPPAVISISGYITNSSANDETFVAGDVNGTGEQLTITSGAAGGSTFAGVPIITSQTMYYKVGAGAATISITGYTF